MSYSEQEELRQAPEELRLTEAAAIVPQSLREAITARAAEKGIEQPPDTKLLQIIRPCVGQGKGRRYYSPEMLESHAGVFTGARMFRNHLTSKQRQDLEGLPRPVEHLGGRIIESWWDGEVQADSRFERGGVYGFVKPVRMIRELLDDDSDLVEASISALATSVRAGERNGQKVAIVEGIRKRPISVDWVTEAGAAGRVLQEAAEEEEAVLESMTDDEVKEYLEEKRPGLLEALQSSEPTTKEGDVPPTITPEIISEALASDDGKRQIAEAVEEALSNYQPPEVDEEALKRLVVQESQARVDLARIEARGDLDRKIELRDLRDEAKRLVEAAQLHPSLAAQIEAKYALDESGEPTPALDIAPDLDDDGNITKRPKEKLAEALNDEIESARKLAKELSPPTRVRGQGGGSQKPAVKPGEKVEEAKTTGSDLTDELFTGAGIPREQLSSIY